MRGIYKIQNRKNRYHNVNSKLSLVVNMNGYLKGYLNKMIAMILVAVFMILAMKPMSAMATTEGLSLTSDSTHSNGVIHAFYPANAVFSEQLKKYIEEVDSLSVAWSRLDSSDPMSLNTTKGKNGNTGFYYPSDYLQVVKYAKEKGKSIQLNVYMDQSDGTKLLPDEEKQASMVQAVVDTMQADITAGEGIYYDGVVIDFEGLRDTNDSGEAILYDGKKISTYFTEYLMALKQQLTPLGKKLYVAVNPKLYYDGYDYTEILEIADRVILMAHDYEPTEKLTKEQVLQYTGYDAIEPVSSLAPILLVRRALNDMKSAASDPSQLNKVWLQITFDSAQWQYDVSSVNGWSTLDNTALSRTGRITPLYASIKTRIDNTDGYGKNITYGYNNELQSPFIQYFNSKDKSWNIILYEDSNSIEAKIDLAFAYGIGGISVWSLGNIPDYNDAKGKEFHLNGWASLVSKMDTEKDTTDNTKNVTFTDKTIETAIRKKLYKTSGALTAADVKSVYRLKLPTGVKSLTDLKKLSNLEYLDASQLGIKDITTIGSLSSLRVLYLQRNKIVDISSLKKLTKLEKLSVNGNQITSISSLATLTKLKELYLGENKITDITALKKLTQLEVLNLGTNSIKKVTSLGNLKKLKDLSLNNNFISDISALKTLTSLRNLNLANNKITSIQALKTLINLKVLYLQRNSISNIQSLSALKKLTLLSLNGNAIADIKSLSSLVNLQKLYLAENKLTTLTSLSSLNKLQILSLDQNGISDLKPLANLKKLTELYLPGNQISSITPLKNLKNLEILSLNRNRISSLTSLAGLTSLQKLYLKENKITKVDSLKSLNQLQELYLSGNSITDYSPLKEFYKRADVKFDFVVK